MPDIDLDRFLGRGAGRVFVLSGKERGLDIRRELGLDAVDASAGRVRVLVPADLHRVTPSFVLGLFSKSFEQLAASGRSQADVRAAFFDRYQIEGEPSVVERIEDQLSEGIDDFFGGRSSLAEMIGYRVGAR